MSENDLLKILHASKLLEGLSNEDISMLSSHGKKLTIKGNDIIIEEGQTDHSLFIILKGQVEVVLPKQRGGQTMERVTRIKLSKLAQGDFFGEYSLIDKEPASASVVAIEPCEIFEISKPDFEKILTTSDRLAKIIYKNILKVVIKRIRDINRELDICF